MTPGCTKEACHFRDLGTEFAAVGASRVGISTDPVAKQAKFSDTQRFDYPLLSDADGKVAAQFGVKRGLLGKLMPVKRTTFVIDGVSGVAADAPALRDGHRYQFVGAQSGKALSSGTTGAATTIRDLATDAAASAPQAWTVHEVAAGDREATRRVVLEASDGRVLGATSAGTDLRTVGVDAAAGDAATRWIVNTTDGRTYSLVNEQLGLALDVNGQSTANGATVGRSK